MRDGHKMAVQYSDEMYCSACERRWDVNDPSPPPCEKYEPIDRDKLMMFRMVQTAENHHPNIPKYMAKRVRKEYDRWKKEKLQAAANGGG